MAVDQTKYRIGRRIFEARKRLGLSQTEFGQAVGCATSTLGSWEKGENGVGAADLVRIANFCGLPVSWFYEDSLPDTTVDVREVVRRQLGEGTEVAALINQIDFLYRARAKRRSTSDSGNSVDWPSFVFQTA